MDYTSENKDGPERDLGAGRFGLPPLPTALNPIYFSPPPGAGLFPAALP